MHFVTSEYAAAVVNFLQPFIDFMLSYTPKFISAEKIFLWPSFTLGLMGYYELAPLYAYTYITKLQTVKFLMKTIHRTVNVPN